MSDLFPFFLALTLYFVPFLIALHLAPQSEKISIIGKSIAVGIIIALFFIVVLPARTRTTPNPVDLQLSSAPVIETVAPIAPAPSDFSKDEETRRANYKVLAGFEHHLPPIVLLRPIPRSFGTNDYTRRPETRKSLNRGAKLQSRPFTPFLLSFWTRVSRPFRSSNAKASK